MVSSETKSYPFHIVLQRNRWFMISLVVILAGMVKMGINKSTTGSALNYGIDFTGGSAYIYKMAKLPAGEDSAENSALVRQAMGEAKLSPEVIEAASVQVFTDGGVSIVSPTGSSREQQNTAAADSKAESIAILAALQAKFGDVELVGSDLVGPVIGEHLRKMALIALFWGCLFITLYIWFRYNIKGIGAGYVFGASAIIAMLHDVLVMVAIYAWTGTEVNTNFVAAILTVVGYSINDTVIIFDRIRENLGKLDAAQRRTFAIVEDMLEVSLWQVMGRSVVTIVCTLLPLVTLFLFGGVTIKNFSFSLLLGVLSGGYSSIFTAAPLFAVLYRKVLSKQEAAGVFVPQQRVRPTARPRPTTATRPETPAPAATAPTTAPQPATGDAPAETAESQRAKKAATGSTKRKRRH